MYCIITTVMFLPQEMWLKQNCAEMEVISTSGWRPHMQKLKKCKQQHLVNKLLSVTERQKSAVKSPQSIKIWLSCRTHISITPYILITANKSHNKPMCQQYFSLLHTISIPAALSAKPLEKRLIFQNQSMYISISKIHNLPKQLVPVCDRSKYCGHVQHHLLMV